MGDVANAAPGEEDTSIRPCVRCGRPVRANREQYDLFERMHWLCFHLEYEHGDYDPDESCGPYCFWQQERPLPR